MLFLANVLQLGFFPFACPIFTPYGMALPWTGRFGAWGKRGVWALGCGHLAAPPGPHLCPMAMVILGQTHTKPPGDLHWVAMRGISTRHSTSGTHGGHTSHLPFATCPLRPPGVAMHNHPCLWRTTGGGGHMSNNLQIPIGW